MVVVGVSESTGGDAGDSSIAVSGSGAGASVAAAALEAASKRFTQKTKVFMPKISTDITTIFMKSLLLIRQ